MLVDWVRESSDQMKGDQQTRDGERHVDHEWSHDIARQEGLSQRYLQRLLDRF